MDDLLQGRTRLLLTDYILSCAREPGTPEPPPTSVEAAMLRSVTRQIQQKHQGFFSSFRDYQGNRPELVKQLVDKFFFNDQDLTWDRLAALLAFAGTVVTQSPCRTVKQRRDLWNRLLVDQDCYLTVNLLYNLLMGRYRSWLEAHGGWVRPLEHDGDGLGRGCRMLC